MIRYDIVGDLQKCWSGSHKGGEAPKSSESKGAKLPGLNTEYKYDKWFNPGQSCGNLGGGNGDWSLKWCFKTWATVRVVP